MNTLDYESIWQQSLIRVTDKFSLPPIVLCVNDAVIGTLGNFSVSTGKAKAKKTFNVSAIVAAALVNGQVLDLGTGVNAQQRAVAIHHLDTPWRPSDLEQRNGR